MQDSLGLENNPGLVATKIIFKSLNFPHIIAQLRVLDIIYD